MRASAQAPEKGPDLVQTGREALSKNTVLRYKYESTKSIANPYSIGKSILGA